MTFRRALPMVLAFVVSSVAAAPADAQRVARTDGVEVIDSFGPVVAWSQATGGDDSIAERLMMLRDGKVTRLPVPVVRNIANVAVGPGESGEPVVVYNREPRGGRRRTTIYRFDTATGREAPVPGATVVGSCFTRGFPWQDAVLLVSVASIDGPRRCRNRLDLLRAGRRTHLPIPAVAADEVVDFDGSRILTIDDRVVVRAIDGSTPRVLARERATWRATAYFQPDFGFFDGAGHVVFELFDDTGRTRLLRVSDAAQPALEAGPSGCNLDGPLAADGAGLIVSDGLEINRISRPAFAPIARVPASVRGVC
jgi:hypothetical protein